MNIREETINKIMGEDARVQYDGSDEGRLAKIATMFTQSSVLMIEALAAYVEAIKASVDENSADAMKGARHDLIHAWTTAQGATSMIANSLRFDGDEAFLRAAKAAEANEDVELGDL